MKTKENYSLSDELLEIRVSYLRTVPFAWKSDKNDKRIAGSKDISQKRAQIINILNGFSTYDRLTIKEFNTHLNEFLNKKKTNASLGAEFSDLDSPMSLIDDFDELLNKGLVRVYLENANPVNLNITQKLLFEMKFSRENFGIHILGPTAKWNYYGDNQWTKPSTESLYLGLPAVLPKFNDDFTTSELITSYYEQFPSFLGQAKQNFCGDQTSENNYNGAFITLKKDAVIPPLDPTLNLIAPVFKEEEKDMHGNNYDLGFSEDSFLSLSSVLIKLISQLSGNETLRNRMNYALRLFQETDCLDDFPNSSKTEGTLEIDSIHELSYYLDHLADSRLQNQLEKFNLGYDIEMLAIFRQYFQYTPPFIFHVRLLIPNSEVFLTKESVNGNERYIFNPVRKQQINLVTLEIPYAPEMGRNTENVALALARYNSTGPAYPFTCS